MSDSPSPRRKPGGQPGNTNAFRHGQYSLRNRLADPSEKDSSQVALMDEEIELLREMMRRVIENSQVPGSLQEVDLLHALTLASMSINRILRTQHIIDLTKKPKKELIQALRDVLIEFHKIQAVSDSDSQP